MAAAMRTIRLAISLAYFLLVAAAAASAQACGSQTFSQNRLYAKCDALPVLGATLHWTYHATNGTADVAFRAPQASSGWVAWAINPTGSGMLGANALFAFHDAGSGAVTVITTVIATNSNFNPDIKNENLSFGVQGQSGEYGGGAYTIYATVALPANGTSQNTVWQAGTGFGSNGLPYGHQTSGDHLQSFSRLDFLSGQSAAGSDSLQHRKNIHGVLNAVSWGILLPLGVMIARYLRVFKVADPAWFYLHIACQCSGYILGVAGWGLGLKLGSESKGVRHQLHRNIGISLFCLATLQIFALLLRPDKKTKYRLYWNIYHHSVGYVVIILSIINIFKGFSILQPDSGWKRLYIAIISVLGGVSLALEVITWVIVLKRRARNSDKSHHGTNGVNSYGERQYQDV